MLHEVPFQVVEVGHFNWILFTISFIAKVTFEGVSVTWSSLTVGTEYASNALVLLALMFAYQLFVLVIANELWAGIKSNFLIVIAFKKRVNVGFGPASAAKLSKLNNPPGAESNPAVYENERAFVCPVPIVNQKNVQACFLTLLTLIFPFAAGVKFKSNNALVKPSLFGTSNPDKTAIPGVPVIAPLLAPFEIAIFLQFWGNPIVFNSFWKAFLWVGWPVGSNEAVVVLNSVRLVPNKCPSKWSISICLAAGLFNIESTIALTVKSAISPS